MDSIRRTSFPIILLCLFFLASAVTIFPKEKEPFDLKGFDAWVDQVMKDWKVPGMAVGVVKDGKLVFARGYGFRDVAGKQRVTPKTIFAIGSATKAFTVATMGILVDQGKLDWNKQVREYLPSFRLNDEYATEHMTLTDLVSHRSGLPRHDLTWYGSSATRKELFERLRYLQPSAEFRTAWQYQNLMFMTAGYIVGEVTGSRWEDAVKKMILEPLGMQATNLTVEDSKKAEDFALPYRENKEKKVIEIPFRNIDQMAPAGSINANILDISKWVILNLNKGKYGDKQIISESSIAIMQKPQMVIPSHRLLDVVFSPGIMAYGMGWFINTYRGHLIIHHGGNIDGFSAYVTFAPKENTGIVALTNLDNNPLGMIVAFNLYDRLFGLPINDLNKQFKDALEKLKAEADKQKTEGDKDKKMNTLPSHPLEEYTGEYEHPGYGVITVSLKDGRLNASYNGFNMNGEHFHYDVFKFSNEELDQSVKAMFLMDIKGNISTLEIPLEPSLGPLRFNKLPEKSMQSREFLERFAGKYETMGITATVILRGENTLILTVPGQPEYELVPYKGTEFNFKNLQGFSIEFVLENEKVTKALIKQPNGTFEARKIE